MTTNDYIIVLTAMQRHHNKLEMVSDLLSKLQNGTIETLSERQWGAISKIYAKSWYKEKIDNDIKKLKQQTPGRKEMEEKIESTNVTTSLKSALIDEVERRVPIGFKVPVTNNPPTNRYKMITNVKQSLPRNWSDKQWDDFFND